MLIYHDSRNNRQLSPHFDHEHSALKSAHVNAHIHFFSINMRTIANLIYY